MSKPLSCADKTKLKMAEALKELMHDTSFEKITVSDVTEKCNIHRQTFYYHFQDRYELLDWVIYTDLINPLLSDFTLDNMYDKIYNTFITLKDNKRFYQNALKSNMSNLTRYVNTIATEQFVGVIEKLHSDNGINTSRGDDILIANFFGYGISGIAFDWVQKGMKESPEIMTEHIKALFDTCIQIATAKSKK